MNRIIFILGFTILLSSCNQNESIQQEFQNQKVNEIVIGTIDSLYSNELDETRKFWVHLPKNYNPASDVKYPVVYLLDGDGHFYSVVGMIEQLSTTNGNTICPEMIVVAIPNTDRTRDLTPTHVDVAFGDSSFVKTSGGGDKFLDFIEKELIPQVEEHYPATGYRTFIGHSFGGIAVLNALLKRPHMFANYVAIDPSLWWDDQVLLKKADSIFSKSTYKDKSLFVGVANTMPSAMAYADVERDTTEETDHIRSILKFIKSTDHVNSGLNFGWNYYHDDSHGSVPLITEYDALRFLFPWYTLQRLEDKIFPEPSVAPDELIGMVKQHYKNVSEHFGYDVLPGEGMINGMGYQLLQMKLPEYAFKFFDLNVKNYSKNANVYDSMGDYYLAQSDTVKAIEFFEQAIATGDLSYTKEKLATLKKVE